MFERLAARWGACLLSTALLVGACGGSSSPAGSATPPAGATTPTVAASACSDPVAIGTAYALATCQIPAPSLAGNLLGDPAILNAYIVTPAGYDTSGLSYPVVYVLAGFTDPAIGMAYALSAVSAPTDASTVLPIVVVASGVNALGGGFYVNSSVSGNWEDAIVKDLVGYVDGHYRTLATPASRGIAGASMGGFGAIHLAMAHPELFGALYAMSPGLFDQDGATARLADPTVISVVLDIEAEVADMTTDQAAARIVSEAVANPALEFEYAYGVAFAPDPTSPSLMQFPFKRVDGRVVRDDALWARWVAGFGGPPATIDQCRAGLAGMRGIVIDYGTKDEYAWIPQGSHYFVGLLKQAGIDAGEVTFDGGHNDQTSDRVANHMLPFMIDRLASG
jgi:S-formylglutathione hydrolase